MSEHIKKTFINFVCQSLNLSSEAMLKEFGHTPTMVWTAGDKIENTKSLRKKNGFKIEKCYYDQDDISECFKEFIHKYINPITKISKLDSDIDITITYASYGHDVDGLFIESKDIQLLAQASISINYDPYLL
jgi:Domain of unknown function (DUF4279)